MRIGTRKMAFDDAIGALILEHGRQMVGIEASRAGRYERSKRSGTHQRVHFQHVLDAMMIGLIHDAHRRLSSALA